MIILIFKSSLSLSLSPYEKSLKSIIKFSYTRLRIASLSTDSIHKTMPMLKLISFHYFAVVLLIFQKSSRKSVWASPIINLPWHRRLLFIECLGFVNCWLNIFTRFGLKISHALNKLPACWWLGGWVARFQCHCGCVTVCLVFYCYISIYIYVFVFWKSRLMTNLNAARLICTTRFLFTVYLLYFHFFCFCCFVSSLFLHLTFITALCGGVGCVVNAFYGTFFFTLPVNCAVQKLITYFIFNTHCPNALT